MTAATHLVPLDPSPPHKQYSPSELQTCSSPLFQWLSTVFILFTDAAACLVCKVLHFPTHHSSYRGPRLLTSRIHHPHPICVNDHCWCGAIHTCGTEQGSLTSLSHFVVHCAKSRFPSASNSSHSEPLNIAVSSLLFHLSQCHLHLVNPTCPADLSLDTTYPMKLSLTHATSHVWIRSFL